ncbi:MAG: hydroxyacylglutathione hydrolase [Gaiellaceae bacterium]|nr:hydroxyacylglutathione hydrolase [Gaiellaceae bacterium]
MIEIVDQGVARIQLPKPAAHVYVLLGERPALVDAGLPDSGPAVHDGLRALGILPDEVALVLLTHEHADHAGGARAFPNALLAAHPLAAAKLRHGDRRATHARASREPELELYDRSLVHAGGFALRVLHTPGHTSGSICLYEESHGLLFTGDTAFARGTLTDVFESGSRGDHMASLQRLLGLPVRLLLPGHGHVSEDPRGDLTLALDAARETLPRRAAS